MNDPPCVSVPAQVDESSCSPARWNRAPAPFPEAEVNAAPPGVLS